MAEYFRAAGIKNTLKKIEPALWGQRVNACELQATLIWSAQTMWRNGTWTDYLPQTYWAPEWKKLMDSNGESGE